ncbi:MAG TPA: hypothetical protein VN903_05425, partial [Polyangia bacterium]|nr:hypothetical protein [Polyangia bacterium]
MSNVCANATNGTTCDDGDVCTQGETCQSGVCQATATYPTVLDLPIDDLGGTGIATNATDVNATGTVVGYSLAPDYARHAWRWTAPGPVANLEAELGLSPPSSAQAINDSGTIIGYQTLSDGAHAFRSGAAGVEDVGNIGDGTSAWSWGEHLRGTYPTSINSGGDLVGNFVVSGTVHGFRSVDGVPIEDVGTLVSGGTTLLYGISESGTAVGSSWAQAAVPSSDRAVLYDNPFVGLVDLNDVVANPIDGFTLAAATSISGDYIAGWGVHDGQFRAFRLKRVGVLYELDEITGGWVSGWAWDVNASGDVVGAGGMNAQEYALNIGRAFVFTDQLGFKRLDDLIPQDSGWTLGAAYAINASGEITGWGRRAGYGPASHPFRLKLPPGEAATCQARNVCGAGDSDSICLYLDGVVPVDGHFVAVFGFDNGASTSVHPTINEVRRYDSAHPAGALVPNPQPAPPANFLPGTRTGAFLPTLNAGEKVAWTVGSETVTADASASPHLEPVTFGTTGIAVEIAGQRIVIRPDIGSPTPQGEPQPGAPFNGALTGMFAVSP